MQKTVWKSGNYCRSLREFGGINFLIRRKLLEIEKIFLELSKFIDRGS